MERAGDAAGSLRLIRGASFCSSFDRMSIAPMLVAITADLDASLAQVTFAATLYFLLRYPGQVNDVAGELEEGRLPVLLGWHNDHPVTEHERHRNAAIFEKQGNRNPLIDFPEWAGRIDFRPGLG